MRRSRKDNIDKNDRPYIPFLEKSCIPFVMTIRTRGGGGERGRGGGGSSARAPRGPRQGCGGGVDPLLGGGVGVVGLPGPAKLLSKLLGAAMELLGKNFTVKILFLKKKENT